MSFITSIGEGKVAKEGAEQAGALAQLVHEFNAQIDLANADFSAATTKQNVVSARKEGQRELSAQRAAIGASGLTAESFASVSTESAMEVEKDVLAIELQGAVNEFNLRQSANIERASGEAAKFGATVTSNAAKQNAIGGVVQGASQLISFF